MLESFKGRYRESQGFMARLAALGWLRLHRPAPATGEEAGDVG